MYLHNVFFSSPFQESPIPEDKDRRFVLSYFLATDMISIFEPPVRNSGIIGGKYLGRTKVVKPGSSMENPVYYGPSDFFIGAVIEGRSQQSSGFPTGLIGDLTQWTLVGDVSLQSRSTWGSVS